MKHSESIGKIAAAIAKFQGDIKGVSKNAQGHGYKYMTYDAIMTLIRPELSKHELCVIQNVSGDVENGISVAYCETLIAHSSGEWMKSDRLTMKPMAIKAGAPVGPREVGSALTYAKRYQLCGMLGISSDTDDDAYVAQNKLAWGQVKTNEQAKLIEELVSSKCICSSYFSQLVLDCAVTSKDYNSYTVEEANTLINVLNDLPQYKTKDQGAKINALIKTKGVTQSQFTQMVAECSSGEADYKKLLTEDAEKLIVALSALPDVQQG